MMWARDEFDWTKGEKHAARNAFKLAYGRECKSITAKLKEMIARASEPADLWQIHDYLSERRRETDKKYDYRYSVLLTVFARLWNEGWLEESDFQGMGGDKILRIKEVAALRAADSE